MYDYIKDTQCKIFNWTKEIVLKRKYFWKMSHHAKNIHGFNKNHVVILLYAFWSTLSNFQELPLHRRTILHAQIYRHTLLMRLSSSSTSPLCISHSWTRILSLRNIFIYRFINQYLYRIAYFYNLEFANNIRGIEIFFHQTYNWNETLQIYYYFISSRRKTVILYRIRAIVPCKYLSFPYYLNEAITVNYLRWT